MSYTERLLIVVLHRTYGQQQTPAAGCRPAFDQAPLRQARNTMCRIVRANLPELARGRTPVKTSVSECETLFLSPSGLGRGAPSAVAAGWAWGKRSGTERPGGGTARRRDGPAAGRHRNGQVRGRARPRAARRGRRGRRQRGGGWRGGGWRGGANGAAVGRAAVGGAAAEISRTPCAPTMCAMARPRREAQPRRCHIVAHLTATMSHRRGWVRIRQGGKWPVGRVGVKQPGFAWRGGARRARRGAVRWRGRGRGSHLRGGVRAATCGGGGGRRPSRCAGLRPGGVRRGGARARGAGRR
jgi:hypothetical protein